MWEWFNRPDNRSEPEVIGANDAGLDLVRASTAEPLRLDASRNGSSLARSQVRGRRFGFSALHRYFSSGANSPYQ